MERRQQQLTNLVALFEHSLYLLEQREYPGRGSSHLAPNVAGPLRAASAVERFGWWRVAAACGFVPIEEARKLLTEQEDIVWAPADMAVTTHWRELFPHELIAAFDAARADEDFMKANDAEFIDGDSLWPFLQTAVALAADFASNGQAQSFVAALNFLSDDVWKDMLARPLSVDGLILSLSVDTDVLDSASKQSCFCGFFKTVAHLAASKRMAAHLQASRAVSPADRGTMRRAVRQAQTWRVNFKLPVVRQRLEEFAAYAGRIMVDEVKVRDLGLYEDRLATTEFVKIVADLANHWIYYGQPEIGLTAVN